MGESDARLGGEVDKGYRVWIQSNNLTKPPANEQQEYIARVDGQYALVVR